MATPTDDDNADDCISGNYYGYERGGTLAKAASYPLVLLGRNFILTHEIFEKCQKQKLTPQVLHYSPHLSTIWNIVRQGIAFSILTSNGIPPESGLAAIPIKGMSQRGFVVIKKGRQIYSGERLLIDFVRQKFVKV